jgi:hypothetical protein
VLIAFTPLLFKLHQFFDLPDILGDGIVSSGQFLEAPDQPVLSLGIFLKDIKKEHYE